MSISNIMSAQVTPNNLNEQWELWYDEVPVGGRLEVGMVVGSSAERVRAKGIYVYIPEKVKGTINLSITSMNGVYEGFPEYSVSTIEADTLYLEWPTEYEDELSKFKYYEIAILAKLIPDGSIEEIYLPAFWTKDSEIKDKPLTIILNSRSRTYIKVENEIEETKRVPCSRIDEKNSVAFNCLCEVPRELINVNSKISIVQRLSSAGTINFSSYRLPMRLN